MKADLLKILFEAEVRKNQRKGANLEDALLLAGDKLKKNIIESNQEAYLSSEGDR